MAQNIDQIQYVGKAAAQYGLWNIPQSTVSGNMEEIQNRLLHLHLPCFIVSNENQTGISNQCDLENPKSGDAADVLAYAPPFTANQLGEAAFRQSYGLQYNYYGGAMANGISSEDMVIAMGKSGLLGSFGAAGLVPSRIESAIQRIQKELPNGPYAFNLIHSPSEEAIEKGAVELFLKYGVHVVEASAYMALTPHIVYYRVAGLGVDSQNQIEIKNKVIAKISRKEVATQFMQPAPERIIKKLLAQNLITEQQAKLAANVPMADDITVEADSGGHTDNRPLVALLPSIISLRDEIQKKYEYQHPIRVGAGGGIGTPNAALATFMMGAAYIVTGSVNQACVEAGASEHTRKLLAQADMADVTMAPASDMFELGVKLQVLKKGTMFPMRAQKLYDLYSEYGAIEEIPAEEKDKLEKQIFRKSLDTVWKETMDFFNTRDPRQIERALGNPKRKMALIFRWYLGLSSRWSNSGEPGREIDYQIWCGPSIGAFNAWVENSYLSDYQQRKVVDVAKNILTGAAYLYRLQVLKAQGVKFPYFYEDYQPKPDLESR